MARDIRGEERAKEPRELREEDVGKPIVAPAGITVGTVGTVDPEGSRATVERTEDSDSLTAEIMEWLGWGDDGDDSGSDGADDGTREIRPEHVDRYEDGRVYLRDRP